MCGGKVRIYQKVVGPRNHVELQHEKTKTFQKKGGNVGRKKGIVRPPFKVTTMYEVRYKRGSLYKALEEHSI